MTAVHAVCKWPLKRKGFRLQSGVISLHISERALLGPDLVCRISGSVAWVKVVKHFPGYQERRNTMAVRVLGCQVYVGIEERIKASS